MVGVQAKDVESPGEEVREPLLAVEPQEGEVGGVEEKTESLRREGDCSPVRLNPVHPSWGVWVRIVGFRTRSRDPSVTPGTVEIRPQVGETQSPKTVEVTRG